MNSFIAIALSVAVAGFLDIATTGLLLRSRGTPFPTLLQYVASGALGKTAFKGGQTTALIGLFLHFLIAAIWSVAFFLSSNSAPDLRLHPWAFGAIYGMVVHLAMSLIVTPLSRTEKRPFVLSAWLIQLTIHIVCVGLPISLVQSWWLTR